MMRNPPPPPQSRTIAGSRLWPLNHTDALLLRTGGADSAAFALLYDRTSVIVWRTARAQNPTFDEARILLVVETAFLEIWRTAPLFDPAQRSGTAFILRVLADHASSAAHAPQRSTRQDAPIVLIAQSDAG